MAAGVKLTEKAVVETIGADAHVVVTMPVEVDGETVESVRRTPVAGITGDIEQQLNDLLDALPGGTVGPSASVSVSDALPIRPRELTVELAATQSGSGDPSPENIRPITGATGLTLTHTAGGEAHTYSVTWETSAGTVYGGVLDVLAGTLTVNSMMATLSTIMNGDEFRGMADLGSCWRLGLTYIAADGSMSGTNTGIDLFASDNVDAMCDWLVQTPKQYNRDQAGFYLYGTHGVYVKFSKSSFADAEAIEAYLSEHPLHIMIGSLTNPTVYHVNPAEVKLGRGSNTITTDAGEITLRYVKELS